MWTYQNLSVAHARRIGGVLSDAHYWKPTDYVIKQMKLVE